MAKATKLPSGTWRVNLYLGKVDGKEVRRSITGRTKKEAEQNAARYMLENHLNDTPMTVGEAVDKYIMNVSVTLSPSTIKGYRVIQKHTITGIMSYMADKVTNDDLQKWVNSLSRKYSPKTVKNSYSLVHAAIKEVRPGFAVNVKLPTPDAKLIVIPTEEDVQKMLDAADPLMRRCIMLAAFCSLRRGEICFLRYKDVKDGCIAVHGDVVPDPSGRWVEKAHAKTDKSNRTIRMPDFVAEAIGTGDPEEKVVDWQPNWLTKKFGRLMKSLGMTYNFHLLRHFFASSLIAQGVPVAYIQALGGWESTATLEKIYTHILQSSKNEYNAKVTDYFSSKFS